MGSDLIGAALVVGGALTGRSLGSRRRGRVRGTVLGGLLGVGAALALQRAAPMLAGPRPVAAAPDLGFGFYGS